MSKLQSLRDQMQICHLADEAQLLQAMEATSDISVEMRRRIVNRATGLIQDIRSDDKPALLEVFLAEYGLSTDEGVALMCLAEALMRVPDADTIDELIEDKIAPSAWSKHKGNSHSLLVNVSTWGLMLTGKVLESGYDDGVANTLKGMIKRLGEPVIRTAVKRAMKELGNQFVLGETIAQAVERGKKPAKAGYTFSYDMLGEAALTEADAKDFFAAYQGAIEYLSRFCKADSVADNPGISIKLSALHPRYEVGQSDRVMTELVERTLALTLMAKEANMGLNIDAEESERLDLSLDIIEAVLQDERLAGWDGFGVVVQAYGKRAHVVLDWLYSLAQALDRKIMVRLVKGAYWDSEIKRAQTEGVKGFPVYTRKSATDCAYIYCAEKLLNMTDRIYPQFATHNANSVASILTLADDNASFEFQRLHGMGEALHRLTLERERTRCRIYAPVGPHRDLLAYLVRRLLENGANSSFVNQIVDLSTPASAIADDPINGIQTQLKQPAPGVVWPADIYGSERVNAKGWDLASLTDLAAIEADRSNFKTQQWHAKPLLVDGCEGDEEVQVLNPANFSDAVGTVLYASKLDVTRAVESACPWSDTPYHKRAQVLKHAADLMETNYAEIFALLTREAGKTPADAIAELREAVDFLRYYAVQAGEHQQASARGIVLCISPWNFPVAIFVGQIAAALSVGNAVLAKPAEQTSLCADFITRLLHQAGVPVAALQLLPGKGAKVGAALVSTPELAGVCFTGSTATAQAINRGMALSAAADAPLIAETGGLNAMIVDSTALPEQAVKDVVASAFQSAGQRCSALRVLYLQEDIAEHFLSMLYGAMDELVLGDPWSMKTDVGPVIDVLAQNKINQHIAKAKDEGRLLKQLDAATGGTFVGPAVLKINGISDLQEEIFGPVLHVTTFKVSELDQVLEQINATGFGLTFGLHTRIDRRVRHVTQKLNVGNMYVNRNQIGAIVGSQPFGGEGLSGTGPKAGGPHYVQRFTKESNQHGTPVNQAGSELTLAQVQDAIAQLNQPNSVVLNSISLPGPTGESNVLSFYPRGIVLCLGPTLEQARTQASIAKSQGCVPLIAVVDASEGLNGYLPRALLTELTGFDAVAVWSNDADKRQIRQALAARQGALIPVITEENMASRCQLERHICIDMTAAGGNASLLAQSS